MLSKNKTYRMAFVLLALVLLLAIPVVTGAAGENGITSPEGGATISGSVEVTGVAADSIFEKWQLDIMVSGDEGSASFVALGEEQVAEEGTLVTLDTTMYPDGDYTLRLRVVGTDGQYDEYFTEVTIANGETPAAAPAAEEAVMADETDMAAEETATTEVVAAAPVSVNGLTSPKDSASVSGSVDVMGVAVDPNFEKWQLDIMGGGDANNASFIALGEEQIAEAATLATVDTTMYPDGDYTLRLRVVRTDGQYDEYYTDVTIANGETPAAAPAAEMDIVDTAVAAGSFNTLVAAVDAAGLVETLKGDGPFTVFAPTDEAFAALPEGTVEALLADIPTLTNILLYHVVPGKVMAADVVGLDSADTAAGLPVAISVEGDKVMIGNAQIITTDIETSNGVIHVVDAVILPPAEEAEEAVMADEADMATEETATTEEVAAAPAIVNGITSPEEGATISGSIEVMGLAVDPNFEKWQLDILGGGDEDNASFIALGEEQVSEASALATVDTTMYPDGDYTLRLRVVHSDGQYDEYFIPITIANG